MTIIIDMPKLSDTMEEGGIASWLKKEGEFVEEGEILVEIETDKAAMEYACPEEGYLRKILVQPGTNVPLQTPIAVLTETKDEEFSLDSAQSSAPKAPKKADSAEPKQVEEAPKQAAGSLPTPSTTRIKASPLAKKIAKDQNIELESIQGSGPAGRIVMRDLENIESSATTSAVSQAAPTAPSGQGQTHNISMMRKTIAKRLQAAKVDAPHFYLTVACNMDKALEWRQELNGNTEDRSAKISVNDIVVLATAKALMQHPEVNSSWQEDHIYQFDGAHISIAVALPTGLITPVVFHAQNLGIRTISSQIKNLAQKAKEGSLTPAEYAGGSFTISNLGMTRVEHFTAIINPPQSCILAVGTTVKTPVVVHNDQLKVVSQMKMTLSCDHRVVDGMVGARFLETLCSFLENPITMLE